MMREIELYKEPLDIFEKKPGLRALSEMSDGQLAFLCGLIKDKRPSKILEVGVSAGGTTTIILNCCAKIGIKPDIFSVDLMNLRWNDSSKKVGYAMEMSQVKGSHTLLTGHTVAKYLDEIGGGVDFLILDTTHFLPGEILDFLVCFPYLSDNAIVVMHDVVLCHYSKNPYAYATQVLFDSVTAEKYRTLLNTNDSVDNIAAFQITKDTERYIEDVFSSLTITWNYMPDEWIIREYRDVIKKKYNKECNEMFEHIVSLQKETRLSVQILNHAGRIRVDRWAKAEKVFLYGYGYWGDLYYQYAERFGLSLDGIVVSDGMEISEDIKEKFNVPIYHLSELSAAQRKYTFILAVGHDVQPEIMKTLVEEGCYNIL